MKKFQVLLILAMVFSLICQSVDENAGSEENNNNKKRAISYQSIIKNSQGQLIEDGKYKITFNLYSTENDEKPVWFENQNIEIKDGILNAFVGSQKKFKPSSFGWII